MSFEGHVILQNEFEVKLKSSQTLSSVLLQFILSATSDFDGVPPQTQSNSLLIFSLTPTPPVNAKFRNQPLDHVKKNFKVFNRYPTAMPDNCQFWYTTALFRPVKLRQKMH